MSLLRKKFTWSEMGKQNIQAKSSIFVEGMTKSPGKKSTLILS